MLSFFSHLEQSLWGWSRSERRRVGLIVIGEMGERDAAGT